MSSLSVTTTYEPLTFLSSEAHQNSNRRRAGPTSGLVQAHCSCRGCGSALTTVFLDVPGAGDDAAADDNGYGHDQDSHGDNRAGASAGGGV